jgi:hypothetical protein
MAGAASDWKHARIKASRNRPETAPGVDTADATIDMKPQPQPSTQEVLAGLIERVTYHDRENGFCVLRVKAPGIAMWWPWSAMWQPLRPANGDLIEPDRLREVDARTPAPAQST